MSLGKLLCLYNKVWDEGNIPVSWKEALIVPIHKPGKDASKPSNYRPIALTSNICKLMERMINERILYILESKQLLAPYQSGFRKGRQTMDLVVCLEDEVRKVQVNKESVCAVFFDVEKAYDMLWRDGLLIKLHQIGIGGKLFNWIMDFLRERSIQVLIGTEVSKQHVVENGTPQGSVVSPTLFSIMINDIFVNISPDMGRSLFADDGAIWKRGRNIKYVTRKMQEGVSQVEEWGIKWGFRFSIDKSKVMLFTRCKVRDLNLKLYDGIIERVESFRFLGVHFDERLTWRTHIDHVINKSKSVLNLMRCLTGVKWGADFTSLKFIYVALVRSRLDYGCVVYRSAAKSVLDRLDIIQNQALRICLGAVRTSPICALQVEAGEMPLHLRRDQLLVHYWIYLKGHEESHPAKAVMKRCWEREKAQKESFGWKANQIADNMGVFMKDFEETVLWPDTPVWMCEKQRVDFEVLYIKQKRRNADLASEFYELMNSKYKQWTQIFTDGSKDPQSETVGSAVSVPEFQFGCCKRISDHMSVYAAELYAMVMAMEWAEKSNCNKIIVCSDSVSALTSIKTGNVTSHHQLVYEVLFACSRLVRQGRDVAFIWVPAHLGIIGNERADKLAKKATKKETIEVNIKLSKSEGKSIVWRRATQQWQQRWESEGKGRHLFAVQDRVWVPRWRGNKRKQQVIMSRMRIGHSCLNGTLKLMGKHLTGLCEQCSEEETIEHVLLFCSKYTEERKIMLNKLEELGNVGKKLKHILEYGECEQGRKEIFKFLVATGLDKRI